MSRLTKSGVAIGVSLPGVRSPGVGLKHRLKCLRPAMSEFSACWIC